MAFETTAAVVKPFSDIDSAKVTYSSGSATAAPWVSPVVWG